MFLFLRQGPKKSFKTYLQDPKFQRISTKISRNFGRSKITASDIIAQKIRGDPALAPSAMDTWHHAKGPSWRNGISWVAKKRPKLPSIFRRKTSAGWGKTQNPPPKLHSIFLGTMESLLQVLQVQLLGP